MASCLKGDDLVRWSRCGLRKPDCEVLVNVAFTLPLEMIPMAFMTAVVMNLLAVDECLSQNVFAFAFGSGAGFITRIINRVSCCRLRCCFSFWLGAGSPSEPSSESSAGLALAVP